MPVDKQVQFRYHILNRCFKNRYKEYTIDSLVQECNKILRNEFGVVLGVSKRTIQTDIANLQLPPYNVLFDETLRNGRKKVYRYLDPGFSLFQSQMNDEEKDKITQAIEVLKSYCGEPLYDWACNCLVQIESGIFNEERTSFVSFQTNPDLKGITLFSPLLDVIVKKHTIKLIYKPFDHEIITAKVYPYHLKQYNDRWYLLAKEIGYDSISLYAVDRIESFEEIALPYIESNITFDEYFDDVIGVSVPSTEAEDIILKVKAKRFNYIKTKPLHLSQRIVKNENEYITCSINVKINNELESLILSFGSDIEVISPEILRKRIKWKIHQMSELYMNNEENLH